MFEKFDYESVTGFDWDERKSRSNLAKHGIAFDAAVEIFTGRLFFDARIETMRSDGSR